MTIKICSSCGADYHDDDILENFYPMTGTADGLRPDCKICVCDAQSVNYYNKQLQILDKRYSDYHDPEKHDAKKAYFAQKRREYRARQREQLAASA